MQRHHRSLREPDNGQIAIGQGAGRQLFVQIAIERRRGGPHAFQDGLRAAVLQAEPLASDRRHVEGQRPVRREELGIGEPMGEIGSKGDQIVARPHRRHAGTPPIVWPGFPKPRRQRGRSRDKVPSGSSPKAARHAAPRCSPIRKTMLLSPHHVADHPFRAQSHRGTASRACLFGPVRRPGGAPRPRPGFCCAHRGYRWSPQPRLLRRRNRGGIWPGWDCIGNARCAGNRITLRRLCPGFGRSRRDGADLSVFLHALRHRP